MFKLISTLRSLHISAFCLMLIVPGLVSAEPFDPQLSLDGHTLYLNGEGPRKKAFLTIYDTALYLSEKGSDAAAIVAADHPMAMSLVIRSKLATAKRISSAFEEGLENSTGGDTAAIASQTKTFLAAFDQGVVKNDAFQFMHVPGVGVNIYKNGENIASIEGTAFKQALFGIWLSDNPISDKLKAQLLGQ